MAHELYRDIIRAVNQARLTEPFGTLDFEKHCPGWSYKTYRVFLSKHCKPHGPTTYLFEDVSPPGERGTSRRFKLVRPLKYGL